MGTCISFKIYLAKVQICFHLKLFKLPYNKGEVVNNLLQKIANNVTKITNRNKEENYKNSMNLNFRGINNLNEILVSYLSDGKCEYADFYFGGLK